MKKTCISTLKTKVICINFNKLDIAFYCFFCIVRTLNNKILTTKQQKKGIMNISVETILHYTIAAGFPINRLRLFHW